MDIGPYDFAPDSGSIFICFFDAWQSQGTSRLATCKGGALSISRVTAVCVVPVSRHQHCGIFSVDPTVVT